MRLADWREGVENAYKDGGPLDCYVPYEEGWTGGVTG
jgi:hypothetical protein